MSFSVDFRNLDCDDSESIVSSNLDFDVCLHQEFNQLSVDQRRLHIVVSPDRNGKFESHIQNHPLSVKNQFANNGFVGRMWTKKKGI